MISTRILSKSVGRAFYYENAGVFLILFLLAFGFLSGTEHRAIAMSIAGDFKLLFIVLIFWTLYTVKTILFFQDKLYSKEYSFIWNLSLFPPLSKWSGILVTQAIMNLPISLYALFILQFSITIQNQVSAGSIVCFILINHIVPTWYYHSLLHKSHQDKKRLINLFTLKAFRAFKKPSWCWPILASLKDKPALWFISKPLGVFILIVFCNIDAVEQYDIRWLTFGVMIVFSTNLPILFDIYSFRKKYFSIYANLPLPISKVVLKDSLMILAIVFFEILVLINSYSPHHEIMDITSLVLFGFLINWLSYLALSIFEVDLENYLRRYFFIFIALFVSILFQMPFSLLILLCVVFLVYIYLHYYRLIVH